MQGGVSRGDVCLGGVCVQGVQQGMCDQGCVALGGVHPQTQRHTPPDPEPDTHRPPVNRTADRYKNIAFRQLRLRAVKLKLLRIQLVCSFLHTCTRSRRYKSREQFCMVELFCETLDVRMERSKMVGDFTNNFFSENLKNMF